MDPRYALRAAVATAVFLACFPPAARAAELVPGEEPPGVVRLTAEQPGLARVTLSTAAEDPGVDELPPVPPAPAEAELMPLEPAPAGDIVLVSGMEAPVCNCDPWARLRRAGNPQCVAPWARFTYGPKYCGYYVGGGAALYGQPDLLHGEPRYEHEGTFGMDYAPRYSRVVLNWFHGTRYQAGEGQYEPNHHNNPFEHFFGR